MSPTTAALITSLPAHERELLEAFQAWKAVAHPANHLSSLLRLSGAGDRKPALRPHILAALTHESPRFTADGVLAHAEALFAARPVSAPVAVPSSLPLRLQVPTAEEIEAAIEEEEGDPEYGDLFPIVVKSAPAGVVATAWGWREEALPPALPSASVEASTPSERTAWIDSALGPEALPVPTLDDPEAPAPASTDAALLEIAPAWVFEGEPERVFVRSRTSDSEAYAVTVKGGVATACSCPSRKACWHLEAALMAEAWEGAARRLIASEGLAMMRALWGRIMADAKGAGRRQVAAAMRRFCLTV